MGPDPVHRVVRDCPAARRQPAAVRKGARCHTMKWREQLGPNRLKTCRSAYATRGRDQMGHGVRRFRDGLMMCRITRHTVLL